MWKTFFFKWPFLLAQKIFWPSDVPDCFHQRMFISLVCYIILIGPNAISYKQKSSVPKIPRNSYSYWKSYSYRNSYSCRNSHSYRNYHSYRILILIGIPILIGILYCYQNYYRILEFFRNFSPEKLKKIPIEKFTFNISSHDNIEILVG